MTKPEVVRSIAQEACITNTAAEVAVNQIRDIIVNEVRHNGRFAMEGIGVFTLADRKAKVGRNPRTGERVDIPATKVVKFKPSVAFKGAVAG